MFESTNFKRHCAVNYHKWHRVAGKYHFRSFTRGRIPEHQRKEVLKEVCFFQFPFQFASSSKNGSTSSCVVMDSRQSCVMVVCNPVAKTMKKLPPINLCSIHGKINPGVVIVVDDTTRSYKVVLVSDFDKMHPDLPRMHVYDSSGGQWRSRSNPPASCISPSSMIFHQGSVYTLFALGRKVGHALAAYNIQEDKWNELRVPLPGDLKVPQLVVAQDRLYMVAGRNQSAQRKRRLEIHRITNTVFKTGQDAGS